MTDAAYSGAMGGQSAVSVTILIGGPSFSFFFTGLIKGLPTARPRRQDGLTLNAVAGWRWADRAAGYVLVYYAAREVREIFTEQHAGEA
jgi:hypothetical protein